MYFNNKKGIYGRYVKCDVCGKIPDIIYIGETAFCLPCKFKNPPTKNNLFKRLLKYLKNII